MSPHELPYTIPIADKIAEQVIQAYLQYIYATFGGSLTLVKDNGKELKNELFQKVASELGIKSQFLSPHYPQSNGILERFHVFPNACKRKHTLIKLDWKGS